MSDDTQTITPERQGAAAQVGAVFNSLHDYVRTLEPVDNEGRKLLTKQLEFAHARIDEAAMWAIKSVLIFGAPPAPVAVPPAETLSAETLPAGSA